MSITETIDKVGEFCNDTFASRTGLNVFFGSACGTVAAAGSLILLTNPRALEVALKTLEVFGTITLVTGLGSLVGMWWDVNRMYDEEEEEELDEVVEEA